MEQHKLLSKIQFSRICLALASGIKMLSCRTTRIYIVYIICFNTQIVQNNDSGHQIVAVPACDSRETAAAPPCVRHLMLSESRTTLFLRLEPFPRPACCVFYCLYWSEEAFRDTLPMLFTFFQCHLVTYVVSYLFHNVSFTADSGSYCNFALFICLSYVYVFLSVVVSHSDVACRDFWHGWLQVVNHNPSTCMRL